MPLLDDSGTGGGCVELVLGGGGGGALFGVLLFPPDILEEGDGVPF